MEKIIFFMLFILISSYPQNKFPDKFLDMKWGSSKSMVKDKLVNNKKATFVREEKTQLVFYEGKFGNNDVDRWIFFFYNNQLASARIELDVDYNNCNRILEDYLKSLKKKYGEYELINSYYNNLGNISGLKFAWYFYSPNSSTLTGVIILDYNINSNDTYLNIIYGDEIRMSKLSEQREKEDQKLKDSEL